MAGEAVIFGFAADLPSEMTEWLSRMGQYLCHPSPVAYVLDNNSPATGLEEVAKPPKPNRNAAKSCQDDVVRHMVRTLGKGWHIRSLLDGQNSDLPTWTTYTDALVPTTTGTLYNVLEAIFSAKQYTACHKYWSDPSRGTSLVLSLHQNARFRVRHVCGLEEERAGPSFTVSELQIIVQ